MPKLTYPKKKEETDKVGWLDKRIRHEGYNQCHDDFTAYLQEALSEERVTHLLMLSFPVAYIKDANKRKIKCMGVAKALREMVGL